MSHFRLETGSVAFMIAGLSYFQFVVVPYIRLCFCPISDCVSAPFQTVNLPISYYSSAIFLAYFALWFCRISDCSFVVFKSVCEDMQWPQLIYVVFLSWSCCISDCISVVFHDIVFQVLDCQSAVFCTVALLCFRVAGEGLRWQHPVSGKELGVFFWHLSLHSRLLLL